MRRLAVPLVVLCLAAPAQGAGPKGTERDAAPTILAAGDSMMRFVDRQLEHRLKRKHEVAFRSDVRIGDGISRVNWVKIARRHVRKHKPRATALFMGAADGFKMRGIACCGSAWRAEYERRVAKMIRIYSRKGKADVYWLTLPAPRGHGYRRQVFNTVNKAIRRAVARSGPRAHIVDTWAVLTPKGRYRRSMMWRGKRVKVRTRDGVHLRTSGAVIVATLVRDAMRKDGVLE